MAAKRATPGRTPALSSPTAVQEAFQTATQHHQAGRLAEAQALYRQVIAAEPRHAEALHLLGVLALQQGLGETAIDLIRRAVAEVPDDPSYHFNLGEAFRAAGRFSKAAEAYRATLAIDPGIADAHFGLGNALYETGDAENAAASYRACLDLTPDDPEAHNNLGNALLDLKRPEDAIECYRAALLRRPDYAEAHANLGNGLLQTDRLDDAEASYRAALKADPNLAQGHVGLGTLEEKRGALNEAENRFRRALEVDPSNAHGHLSLARVLCDRKDFGAAAESGRRALALEKKNPAIHNQLGKALNGLNRWREAQRHFERACELDPIYVDAHFNLAGALLEQDLVDRAAQTYRRCLELEPDMAAAICGLANCAQHKGQFDEAVAEYRRALAVDPDLPGALVGLAASNPDFSDDEVARLLARVEDDDGDTPNDAPSDDNDEHRIAVYFTVAKQRERKGDRDGGFAYYERANALRKKNSRFDAARWSRLVDALIASYSETFFARRQGFGSESDLPVFILGMPRSGTTLVEQIIASHPDAFGAGELYEIQHLTEALAQRSTGSGRYPDCVDALDRGTATALADAYLARLREFSATARRVTDKMPGNFVHLGLIAVLFPAARVIHCQRDPMDTCLSCYLQNFRSLEFTTDLADLGHYYRDYTRLMAHWQATAPIQILDVAYEDMVADQEAVSRRIMDFIGLGWHARCLNFHETARAVQTASMWQARQPIYRSSVARWRKYEKHLGPLKAALGLDN